MLARDARAAPLSARSEAVARSKDPIRAERVYVWRPIRQRAVLLLLLDARRTKIGSAQQTHAWKCVPPTTLNPVQNMRDALMRAVNASIQRRQPYGFTISLPADARPAAAIFSLIVIAADADADGDALLLHAGARRICASTRARSDAHHTADITRSPNHATRTAYTPSMPRHSCQIRAFSPPFSIAAAISRPLAAD